MPHGVCVNVHTCFFYILRVFVSAYKDTTHCYNAIEHIFISLNSICSAHHLSYLSMLYSLIFSFQSFAVSRISTKEKQYVAISNAFFHLVICIYVSFMPFHGSITCFVSALCKLHWPCVSEFIYLFTAEK